MKKLWLLAIAMLSLAAAGTRSTCAQVIGIQPLPMGLYTWNSSTLEFDQVTTTDTSGAYTTTPEPVVFTKFNSSLNQWVPCSSLADCFASGAPVQQILAGNYITISPTDGIGDVTVTGAALAAASGIGVTYNSGTNTWTISNDEPVQAPGSPVNSLQFNSAGSFGGADADWNGSLAFGFNFGNQSSTTTGWSCNGTNCTFTGPNTFLSGQYITISGSGVTCVNGAVAPVLSTGLSSTQFEIAQSLTACSGTVTGTNGVAQSLVGFMVNAGPTGIVLNASTTNSAGGSGGGSINLTASAMNSGTAYNSGDINLVSYSNSLNTGFINLVTNASGNTSGDIDFTTSGNSGGGLNFNFSGTCLTGGCGTHENAVGFNVTLASAGSGPGVDDATTTFAETAPDGADYFINLTTPAGGWGGGSLLKVTTNSANSGANNGAAIFSLVNTANPAQAAFSVTATGPMEWSASNSSLDSSGALTVASCTGCGGGTVTWPATADIVLSNSTNAPAGLAPVNGDCVVGAGGAWTAASCMSGPADTTITVSTSTISANSCSSVTTTTMSGLATTMTVTISPSTDVSAVTGWSPGTDGQLYFTAWPSTSNTMSWYVCNPTASSITPGASTVWNVSAK